MKDVIFMLRNQDKESIQHFLHDIYTIYKKYCYHIANNDTLHQLTYDLNDVLEIYRINNRYIFNIINLSIYYDNNNLIIKINIDDNWQKLYIQNYIQDCLDCYDLLYELK